jgi:hypothetical protein
MCVSILTFVFAVLIIAGSCATRKIAISDEELSDAYTGTWINEEAGWGTPKRVFFPDGTWKEYIGIDTERAFCESEDIIIDKWKDSKGNIFFESSWECLIHGDSGYQLVKISDSGNTLELLFTTHELRVEEWDPDSIFSTYRIWYRQ